MWDKLLKIKTSGRDDSNSDQYRYPYEPTPYSVLERLANSGFIGKKDVLLDYGCGKGRVSFFLNNQTNCRTTGVDFDENMIGAALENANRRGLNEKIDFVCESAERYEINDADIFYFFNPFSAEVLKSVIGKIRNSYYENPREMILFFYYPSDEYVSYLMTVPELYFLDEINCQDLFEGENHRERILVLGRDM